MSISSADTNDLEQSILENSGLEPANASFLLRQVYGQSHKVSSSSAAVYEIPITTARAHSNGRIRTAQEADQSPSACISITICCDLTAPRSQANHDFDQLLDRKRSENLVPAPGRFRCKSDFFRRDLVVFALSEDPLWSVADIDLQLAFMGLPKLTTVWMQPTRDKRRAGHTDPKAARRKIVYKTRKLIWNYGKIAVFVPIYIRAVAIVSEPPRKPSPFLIAMIHAVCGSRIVA